jgi:hypothetical protein
LARFYHEVSLIQITFRRQEAGGRRQEAGGRRQEAEGRRNPRLKKQSFNEYFFPPAKLPFF